MNRSLALTLILLARAGFAQETETLPAAEQFHIRGEYWYWISNLDCQFAKGPGALPGTTFDTSTDLGMPDHDNHEFSLTLRLGQKHRIRASYTRLDYAGDVTASQTYVFNHATFKKGARLVSSLAGGYYTADFQLGLKQGPWGRVALLIGAKIADVDALLLAPGDGTRETATLTAPVPTLGLAGRFYFGRVSLGGELSGLTVGKYGHVFETEVAARVHFTGHLAVGAGYRLMKIRGVDDPDFLDFHLDGVHFGVELGI